MKHISRRVGFLAEMATTEISMGRIFDRVQAQSKEHFDNLWKAAAVSYAAYFSVYATGCIILAIGAIYYRSTGELNMIWVFVAISFIALGILLETVFMFGKIYLAVGLIKHSGDTKWTDVFRYFKKPLRFLYYLLVTLVLSIVTGFGFAMFFILSWLQLCRYSGARQQLECEKVVGSSHGVA